MSTRIVVSSCSAAVLALALAGGVQAAEGAKGAMTGAKQQQAMADVEKAIKVSKLDGMKVNGPDGKAVGEISEAFLDPASGQVNYVVLSKGGTLGFGGDNYLVPWDSLTIDKAQDIASVNVAEEQWASEFSAYEAVEEEEEPAREGQDLPAGVER
jgi:sporulation protein YlmC with PRC-barrel domain